MFTNLPFKFVAVFVAVVCVGALSPQVLGEGTETLGPPAIVIAPGTGVVAAGVGLSAGQPDTISIDIPGDVSQALLYWQGVSNSESGDDTIKVDGGDVVGTLIGGLTFIPGPRTYISCYRADITDLVAPGPNVLSIDGLAFDRNNDGAGVVAIFDDGSGASDIGIRDGCDFVYINNADSPDFPSGTLQTSVPQTFSFAPAASDRTADLLLFAGDVQTGRPNLIEVTVGATTTQYWNLLASTDGPDWDTVRLPVLVPAGETDLTVEMISAPDGSGRNPASLIWLAAAQSLQSDEEEEGLCRITGGGKIVPDSTSIEFSTFGGQCGAPGSPYGEWTHVNHKGPGGKFTFHTGTHSAPLGTFLHVVECLDFPECPHAAANGHNKQIVCEGVGSFKNGIAPDGATAGLHAVSIRWVDSGEPGKDGKQSPADGCPADGFDGTTGDCGCPDYYHITIRETATPASPIIFEMREYITGGNFQMHSSLD